MDLQTVGIIAEYNPFHNGHLWQIKEIKRQKKNAAVIIVMSGHFTQRGEYAVLDKWQRAECAISGGADIVFELPFTAACKSAEFFAKGAVSILNSLNCVSHLCFGSECTDFEMLQKAALLSDNHEFTETAKSYMAEGITYAAALEKARRLFIQNADASLFQPNSILAVEYIKALIRLSSDIMPFVLPRKDALHSDSNIKGSIASATAIRNYISEDHTENAALEAMTEKSRQFVNSAIKQKLMVKPAVWEKLVLYRIRKITSKEIASLSDVSEGLENKIKKAAQQAVSLEQMIDLCTGKRYPRTRILRIIAQIMVLDGHTNFKPYARLLAFNDKGRLLLKKLQQKAAAPIITNFPDFYNNCTDNDIRKNLDVDINATNLFRLLQGNDDTGHDFRQKPVYVT